MMVPGVLAILVGLVALVVTNPVPGVIILIVASFIVGGVWWFFDD